MTWGVPEERSDRERLTTRSPLLKERSCFLVRGLWSLFWYSDG